MMEQITARDKADKDVRGIPQVLVSNRQDGTLTLLPALPSEVVYLCASELRFPGGVADVLLADGRLSVRLLLDGECDCLRLRIGEGEPMLFPARGAREHLFSFSYPTSGQIDAEEEELLRFL